MNKAKSTSLTPSAAAEEAKFARRVLATEARAIEGIEIGPSFHQAVAIILESSGSVVVSGLGKNGPIGQKLCATFASTGTPLAGSSGVTWSCCCPAAATPMRL